MVALYVVCMLFIALPLTLALARESAIKHRLLTHPPYSTLTVKAKTWGVENYCALAVAICTTALIVLWGYIAIGHGDPPGWIVAIVMCSLISSSLSLSVVALRATYIYQSSPKAFNILASFMLFIIALLANISADEHLTIYVGIKGNDLPIALRALTVALSLYWWTIALTIIALALYAFSAALLLKHGVTAERERLLQRNLIMYGSHTQIKITPHNNKKNIYLILAVGMAFTSLIPITFLESFERKGEGLRLKNSVTVTASFHLKRHECFKDAEEGALFALIDKNQIAAAIPDEKAGYTFVVKDCPKPAN